MFDLFGAEMPLAVRFFLAFLIVLGLIGAAAWAVRRFGSARLGGAVRGRQPRLAVIDYASVDARRRLVLVRRDNVEHLVMIGGPTDVVVESNIVRAVPAARDVPAARPPAGVETLPRAIPLPEVGSNGSGGSWPLQPEPATVTTPSREPPPRPQREALTALADDIATHPVPALPPLPSRSRTAPAPRAHPAEPRLEPRPAPQPVNAEAAIAADQSLAEMAQRLEAALRRPKASEKPVEAQTSAPLVSAAPVAEPAPEEAAAVEAPAVPPPAPPLPRPVRPAEAKPTRFESKSDIKLDTKSKEGKLYDTLEQEMASLLGRPPGKTG
jgi:flagellar protein FliO/FliZ